jgi:MerR-like DNA binding protein
MAYTVKELSQLSGVTVRTLHFYEELGLLKPAYYGSNGYRYYEKFDMQSSPEFCHNNYSCERSFIHRYKSLWF